MTDDPHPSEQEIKDIQNDIDSIPKCKECHELVWCDGDCAFDSAKHQREDFFKQHDAAIAAQARNTALDELCENIKEDFKEDFDGELMINYQDFLWNVQSLRTKEQP